MTAEEFEDGLYTILLKDLDQASIDAFKAKGEQALIFADLYSIAEVEPQDYLDDLLDFTAQAGISEFVGVKRQKGFEIWPSRQEAFRDFTIAELKQVFDHKAWPEDTYTFKILSLSEKILRLFIPLVAIVTAIIGLPILVLFLVYRGLVWIWKKALGR